MIVNAGSITDSNPIPTNPISMKYSYWCGQKVSYSFCKDYKNDDCSGKNAVSGAGNIKNYDMSDDFYLYSVTMRYYDAKERGAVTLFENKGCAGPSGAFFATQKPSEQALYNTNDLVKGHLADNTVSSVMVPYGYSVQLFENNGFHGESVIIEGGMYASGDQEMQCIDLADKKFEDKTSSLSVYRTNFGKSAFGYWQSITTTEEIEFDYHVGMKISETSESK